MQFHADGTLWKAWRTMLSAERSVNWLEMNMWLSAFAFKEGKGRNAIVIDPSFIKKAGKHTPHVGTFWSGCAGAVKHGLEILGIGVIDVDLHECMMLKAVQTTLEKGEEKKEMSLYDWYAKVLEDDKVTLQRIGKVLVADHRQGNEDGLPCCEPLAS